MSKLEKKDGRSVSNNRNVLQSCFQHFHSNQS